MEKIKKINLNNTCFVTKMNNEGLASSKTLFKYKQKGSNLTGEYYGGFILTGHIIGHMFDDNTIELLYHCTDLNGQLLAGSSKGTVLLNKEGKLEILLDWKWLFGANKKGHSHYIQVKND